MRVLVVHSSAELYGSDKSLLDLVRLRPADVQVMVAVPCDGPLVRELVAAGAQVRMGPVGKVHSSDLSPRGLLRALAALRASVRWLRELHREVGFDLVHSNSTAVLGGAFAARSLGLPHVWHVREILAQSRGVSMAYRALVGWLSTRVICNSGETRQWIGGPPSRVSVVWNGYERPAEAPDHAAARRSLGAMPGEVLFVLAGRINAWKGHGLLVEAFALMADKAGVPVRLALVGSAFEGQEHFETDLRAAIARSGCADRIGLHAFREDVDAVWVASDVVVVPSTRPEPFGRVAIEAMGWARPVIAAAHGGLKEIVVDGETGLLVKPGDAGALAAAMQRMAASAAEREAMGRAGRARQQAVFSLDAYVRGVLGVMREALAEGRRA